MLQTICDLQKPEPKITERFPSEKLRGLAFICALCWLAWPAQLFEFWWILSYQAPTYHKPSPLLSVMGFVVSMQVQLLKWEVLKEHPLGLFLDTFVSTEYCCMVFPNLHLNKYTFCLSRFSLMISKYPHGPQKFYVVHGSCSHIQSRCLCSCYIRPPTPTPNTGQDSVSLLNEHKCNALEGSLESGHLYLQLIQLTANQANIFEGSSCSHRLLLPTLEPQISKLVWGSSRGVGKVWEEEPAFLCTKPACQTPTCVYS